MSGHGGEVLLLLGLVCLLEAQPHRVNVFGVGLDFVGEMDGEFGDKNTSQPDLEMVCGRI